MLTVIKSLWSRGALLPLPQDACIWEMCLPLSSHGFLPKHRAVTGYCVLRILTLNVRMLNMPRCLWMTCCGWDWSGMKDHGWVVPTDPTGRVSEENITNRLCRSCVKGDWCIPAPVQGPTSWPLRLRMRVMEGWCIRVLADQQIPSVGIRFWQEHIIRQREIRGLR